MLPAAMAYSTKAIMDGERELEGLEQEEDRALNLILRVFRNEYRKERGISETRPPLRNSAALCFLCVKGLP